MAESPGQSQQSADNSAGSSAAAQSSSSQIDSQPTPSPLPAEQCANCQKAPPTSDESSQLKPCPKCQTVRYCSKECQKAHFKVHKKICAALAQAYAESGNQKPVQSGSGSRTVKEGHRGGLQKWQFDT